MNIKGSLPLLILHLLASGPRHGYAIASAIKASSEGVLDFKEGTLYPTLHNLEKQGYFSAFEQEENGRTRKVYRLTDEGNAALQAELGHWAAFTGAVNAILDGQG